MKLSTRLIIPVLPALLLASTAYAEGSLSGSLLTKDQQKADRIAVALLKDPAVQAARAEGVKKWSTLAAYALPDGKANLEGAANEAEYAALREVAAYSLSQPAVIWVSAPPYSLGATKVPGSRYGGDNPDRIYRSIPVDPAHRYEIHGQRDRAHPSNDDFLFEAVAGLIGHPAAQLKAADVDVAADGTFTVTADSSPSNGKRNHLVLGAGVTDILLRDTLADWSTQVPNELTVKRVDTGAAATRSPEALSKQAATEVGNFFDANIRFLEAVNKAPVNHPIAQIRKPEDGVAGAIAAGARFSLKHDEALVITIAPAAAKYVGFQVTDPWFRSRPYWSTSGSLSSQQVKANSDGSLTYVIADHDPGYYNWLSTVGSHDGLLLIRIEDFDQTKTPDPTKVIREAKVVKLSALAAALPADAAKITPAERATLLHKRHEGYFKRTAL